LSYLQQITVPPTGQEDVLDEEELKDYKKSNKCEQESDPKTHCQHGAQSRLIEKFLFVPDVLKFIKQAHALSRDAQSIWVL
jgi:hypothetical protein